jgi:hypothetical protein
MVVHAGQDESARLEHFGIERTTRVIGNRTIARAFRFAALLACMTLVSTIGPGPATANNACTSSCQSAYAQCYRSSGSNRRACESQLQQCLSRCIRRR